MIAATSKSDRALRRGPIHTQQGNQRLSVRIEFVVVLHEECREIVERQESHRNCGTFGFICCFGGEAACADVQTAVFAPEPRFAYDSVA